MPPQITRLILLSVVIVGVYLTARFFLTPPTFGQYGWYRGQALEEIASHPPLFAGKQSCDGECHSKPMEDLTKGAHKTLSCEGCHGPNSAHVADRQIKVTTQVSCLRCHEADPARSAWIRQIESREHYAGDRCTECHQPHQPNEAPDEAAKEAPKEAAKAAPKEAVKEATEK